MKSRKKDMLVLLENIIQRQQRSNKGGNKWKKQNN